MRRLLIPPTGGILTPKTTVSSFDPTCFGPSFSNAGITSTVWFAANLAIYVPFYTDSMMTIKKLACNNGAAVSGNVDVGIYTADGTRLVSIGSTAQSGVFSRQSFDITDTVITPGFYYLAIALDNATGTIYGPTIVAQIGRIAGLLEQTSAFPLPATATFATFARTICPLISGTENTVL